MNSSTLLAIKKINISKEKAYNTIIKPIVTEKSTLLSENNQIVFLVNISSNKIVIKKMGSKNIHLYPHFKDFCYY